MNELFNEDNIQLNVCLSNKYEAIIRAGTILLDHGYVLEHYIKSMIDREEVISTYIGNKIAIPHGVDGSIHEIVRSGISFIQVPQGVSFGEDKMAYIIIGIAGKDGEHMDLLMKISLVCCDIENVDKLINAKTKQEVLNILQLNPEGSTKPKQVKTKNNKKRLFRLID